MTVLNLQDSADVAVMRSVDSIHIGRSMRERGVHREHVMALMALEGRWPPILLSREGDHVIDGIHRYYAAKELGLREVSCVYTALPAEQWYIEFVRRNIRHGLPLTLHERERGARCLLAVHGGWSDRRIGDACAVSASTVARLRSETPLPPLQLVGPYQAVDHRLAQGRVGKDGRVRPVDPRHTRDRIVEALHEHPSESLRAIAARAGASPETVRKVRTFIQNDSAPSVASIVEGSIPVSNDDIPVFPSNSADLLCDNALNSTAEGRRVVSWLAAPSLDKNWRDDVACVPLSRVYELADLARRRASQWNEFANALEARATRTQCRT
jgi:ParB-like chromosome segregation protein Spo0J